VSTNFLTGRGDDEPPVPGGHVWSAGTNFALARNGTAAPSTGSSRLVHPDQLHPSSAAPSGWAIPSPIGFPPLGFNNSNITNEYTAYEARFSGSSVLLGEGRRPKLRHPARPH